MRTTETHEDRKLPRDPSPLTTPPARTRERSADDLEVDMSDPTLDLPFDDSERLEEDADPLRD
jgi:hypothetical protein